MPRYLSMWVALSLSLATPAAAQEESNQTRARALFVEGTAHAGEMRWGEALARFEAAQKLYPHAGTIYNIGICQRALGQYTLARASFRRALDDHRQSGALADGTVANIEGYLREIDNVLATLDVTLAPVSAEVTVDGRPLERAAPRAWIAGTLPPGRGRAPGSAKFVITIDPGPHVFVLSRKGYEDVVVQKTVTPGEREKLDLVLKRLPAALSIDADQKGAAVAVDGVDVGVAPVTLKRPPGRYRVLVRKDGFDAYDARVTLHPAERVDLTARLEPEAFGVHEQWWFWLSIGSAVATTAVVTYFLTRPDPERPALDGGGLGWAIRVP
jgi:tetratricopeptide (TPR) repeat protein